MVTEFIDLYCERTAAGLWSEPLNTISNAGFFVAAWFIAVDLRQRHTRSPLLWILAALVLAIAIGSTLFHFTATAWGLAADVIPIGLMILVYFYGVLRWFFKLSPLLAVVGVGMFIGFTMIFQSVFDLLPFAELANGSEGYFPVFLLMVVVGAVLARRTGMDALFGRRMVLISLVFLASLSFRTLDAPLCSLIPWGVHPLWHVLNAVVLYLFVRLLAEKIAPKQA